MKIFTAVFEAGHGGQVLVLASSLQDVVQYVWMAGYDLARLLCVIDD